MVCNWGLTPHGVTGFCKCLFISVIWVYVNIMNLHECNATYCRQGIDQFGNRSSFLYDIEHAF